MSRVFTAQTLVITDRSLRGCWDLQLGQGHGRGHGHGHGQRQGHGQGHGRGHGGAASGAAPGAAPGIRTVCRRSSSRAGRPCGSRCRSHRWCVGHGGIMNTVCNSVRGELADFKRMKCCRGIQIRKSIAP